MAYGDKHNYSEDMFADTRMSFGEHLEDLRVHVCSLSPRPDERSMAMTHLRGRWRTRDPSPAPKREIDKGGTEMKAITLPIIALLIALTLLFIPAGGSTVQAQEADACGNDVLDVPDSGATFDFTEACEAHDSCYAAGGTEANRNACDSAFLTAMQASCSEMWPSQPLRLRICQSVATTYYLGVHLFDRLAQGLAAG